MGDAMTHIWAGTFFGPKDPDLCSAHRCFSDIRSKCKGSFCSFHCELKHKECDK